MAPLAGEIAAKARSADEHGHVPNARKQKRDESTQRIAGELDNAVQRVVEKAKAQGTYRGHGELVVRRVDPATIRPPGWTPIQKLPAGARAAERRQAILDVLARQPLARVRLRQVLGLTGQQTESDLKALEAEGRIFRGEAVERPGTPPSIMIHLAEEDDMPEPVTADENDKGPAASTDVGSTADLPEQGEAKDADRQAPETDEPSPHDAPSVPDQLPLRLTLPQPITSAQKLDAVEQILAAGPRRQAELAKALTLPTSDFRRLVTPALEAGRFEQRAPSVGHSGRPSPVLAMPGDERDESGRVIEVEHRLIERSCGRDGCEERFHPDTPQHLYHSRECAAIVRRARKGAAPLTERTCALDSCDERFVPAQPAQRYHAAECAQEAERAANRKSTNRRRGYQQEPTMPEATDARPALRDRYLNTLEQLIERAAGERRGRLEDRLFRTVAGAVELAESAAEEEALLDRLERRALC